MEKNIKDFGKMKYNNGEEYKGFWKNDLKDGEGEYNYNNGDYYKGKFKNNLRNGNGILIYSSGKIYDGEWENNKKNGKGKITYKYTNEIFEGYFKNDKKEGEGIIKFNNEEEIKINYKNNEINGESIYYYKNGDIFKGLIDKNYNPIEGIMKYNNGDEYEGKLDNKLFKQGEGKMKYKNGEIYYGKWENNMRNGNGILCLNQFDYEKINNYKEIINKNICEILHLMLINDVYIGNFNKEKKEGKGILFIINSNNIFNKNILYDGNFKENKRFGKGRIYFNKISYFEAEWLDDDKINENKNAIFHYHNEYEYINKYFNYFEWIYFIKNKLYGIKKKNHINKITIR